MKILSAAFTLLCLASATAADIQLSPDGPISTPAAARDAARKAEKPVRINIAAGVYPLAEPLMLTAEDSQVTWEAAPDAKVVFSGGKQIKGWQDVGNGLWKAEVPEVKAGTWYFEQLWINGRRATRARTPNKGFFNMDSHPSDQIFPGKTPDDAEWIKALPFISFVAAQPVYDEIAKIPEAELSDAMAIIPHTWEVHKYRIQKRDDASCAVLLNGPRVWELLTHEQEGRFHLENFRGALDAAGEWFVSRGGELYYMPLPGEDMTMAEVIAPSTMKLVKMDGVRDFTFFGITFAHQNWLCGPNGLGDNQAAASAGAAIELDRCQNVRFDQCEITHTGEYAIWFRDGSRDCSVEHSHLHDLGAGGVKIGPAKWTTQASEEMTPRFITVDDCIIHHGGRVFPGAIGFVVGHSGDNTLTHCDIGDFFYSGISTGWTWGYSESRSLRNKIENNHIHHLGWGYISDMGGFYNLGAAFGTTVRGNHIHHVSSYRYGGWGLYTDEGSTDVLMENNLVHDTSESGFHQHYGYYNTIRNNIFAFGGKAQIQRSRNEGRLSFIFERNIIVWDPAVKLLDGSEYNWKYNEKPEKGERLVNYVMRNNVYWPVGGKMPNKLAGTWTWQEWQKSGRDGGSIVADPLFENMDARDFRLKEGSPVQKTGFKPWDLTQAGVRADGPRGKAWRELAEKESQFPNWEQDSKPWPARDFGVEMETFERAGLKTMPLRGARLDVDGNGDSIGVSEEASSLIPVPGIPEGSSKKSIKFQDAPGLKQTYLPILGLYPKWNDGTLNVTFDAMAKSSADWFVELRTEGGGEYAAGPILTWQGGQLIAGKATQVKLGAVPADEWVRISITAVPGTGKWSATITRQDGTVTEHPDLPCKTTWTQCHYVLWSSLSDRNTALYLDNMTLKRTAP